MCVVCVCVRERTGKKLASLVCGIINVHRFSSPSVQPASDIPRSVNSLSVNIVGGFTFPLPIGSNLK